MVTQHHQIVPPPARREGHPLDLLDARVGAAQIRQREPARRPEMMRELVVLHERAVDDRHAEVHVEQDRDRLQLADDHVREHAKQREDALGVGHSADPLAARPLPLLAQPLHDSLEEHPADADRMQEDEQSHPGPAEPLVDRHPLACGDGERDGGRVAVEQIHIARPIGQCPGRLDPVPDVLNALRSVARDHTTGRLVIEAEGRDAVVLAVEDARLAVRRGRRQPAEPPPQREPVLVHEARQRWRIPELHCPPQVGIRQGIDLQHDQAATPVVRATLTAEGTILYGVVPTEQPPRAWA